MPILIDGYNYLHAWAGIDQRFPILNFAAARDEMLEFLESFREAVRRKVTVVFDGCQAPRPGEPAPEQVEVIYAPGEADIEIERLVRASHSRADLLVVSSDRAVQAMARRLGAMTLGSGTLHRQALREVEQYQQRLEPDSWQKTHPPAREEVAFWLRIFREPKEK